MPLLALNPPTPRSTYTLEDLRDRVRGDLGYRDADWLTDNDIDRWANEAQDILARETHWYRAYAVIATSGGVIEYNIPNRSIAIEDVYYNDDALPLTTVADLSAYDPEWRTAGTGTPSNYFLRGNNILGLWPAPTSGSADALVVYHTGIPPRVAAVQDQFYVPFSAESAIVHYCCLKASIKDAFGEGSRRIETFERLWQQAILDLKRQVNAFPEGEITARGMDALRYGPRFGFSRTRRIPG